MDIISKYFKTDNNPYYFYGNPSNSIFTVNNKYYDPNNGYSEELYNYYINRNDYISAAKYNRMFIMRDAASQKAYAKQNDDMMRYGMWQKALYDRAVTKDQKDALDFYSRVFAKDGLTYIDDLDNKYYKDYVNSRENLKNALLYENEPNAKLDLATNGLNKIRAGYSQNDKTKNPNTNLTAIGLTFRPTSGEGYVGDLFKTMNDFYGEVLYGITGSNYFKPSHQTMIDSFVKELGYTREELEDLGVVFTKSKNEYLGESIEINVDNPLFDKMLYTFGKSYLDAGWLSGKDKDGVWKAKNALSARYALSQMVNTIDSANGTKTDIENTQMGEKQFSSTIYGYLVPEVGDLIEAKKYARTSEERTAINERIKDLQSIYTTQIMSGAMKNKEVYSNFFNEGDDAVEELITDKDKRQELFNRLSDANRQGDLIYTIQEVNGEFGVTMTIPAKYNESGALISKEGQVWVKGLLADACQDVIGNDSKLAALKELGDIGMYNLYHDIDDTRRIVSYDVKNEANVTEKRYGIFDAETNETKAISKAEALQIIDRDRQINDGYLALLQQHLNADGDVINKDALIKGSSNTVDSRGNIISPGMIGIQQLAVAIANDIYTDAEDITLDELLKGDRSKMSWAKGDKLSKADEIYRQLLSRFNYLLQ